MKLAQEFRNGSTFKIKDDIFIVLKAQRHKSTSGKRASAIEMKFKIKNLISGKVNEITIEAGEKMHDIRLDRKKMQFLYESNDIHYFMDQESFEQIELTNEDLEDSVKFLKEEMIINVLMYENKPVGVELSTTIERKIIYTEPGLRGDTTGRASKPAEIEGGCELQVPLFCEIGDILKVDTRTSEYIERVKK